MHENCPVCTSRLLSPFEFAPLPTGTTVYCPLCGTYNISEQFLVFSQTASFERHQVSGALRERGLSGSPYYLKEVDDLLHSVWVPTTPMEQTDKLLLALEKKQDYFGQNIDLNSNQDFPLAYATRPEEFARIVTCTYQAGFVEAPIGINFPNFGVLLSLQAVQRLAELHKSDVNSNQAFVAMWFDPKTEAAWIDGIEPALIQTNYKPLRIDKQEHNNKIDDEIIAAIRKSGLLVADVTGHRQGVYYEAGFAQGLGIPVIWSCSEAEIAKAHFDTRQYSHVVWHNPDDLRRKLVQRIEATLPLQH